MAIKFTCFSHCGTGKAHNEDAVLLDGQVHQGREREHGEVDTSQPRYFAVADGVSTGTLPRTASHRLLELLQTRLATAPATIFNAGDSRAYLLNGGQAQLMSRDHSLLNDLLTEGEITPAQSENAASILRGLTCQFIADGELDEFKVNIVNHVLLPGERLWLCSDDSSRC